MEVTKWFRERFVEKYRSFREKELPSFYARWEKDGFFWAIPRFLRAVSLLLLTVVILFAGITSFALGMSLSVVLLSWWLPGFIFFGLPLGLSGECRVCIAALYFTVLLVSTMALMMASWSRNIVDHRGQQEKREELARKINNDGHVTRVLLGLINAELDFFGRLRYQVHILVFVISLVAFLVKR